MNWRTKLVLSVVASVLVVAPGGIALWKVREAEKEATTVERPGRYLPVKTDLYFYLLDTVSGQLYLLERGEWTEVAHTVLDSAVLRSARASIAADGSREQTLDQVIDSAKKENPRK